MNAGIRSEPIREVRLLEQCISALVSIQNLGVKWTGQGAKRISKALVEVATRLVESEFVYVRCCATDDHSWIEAVRFRRPKSATVSAQEAGRKLAGWQMVGSVNQVTRVANPFGPGELSVASFRLGIQEEIGVVIAGSERSDFPTQIDTILLRATANQAVIALQEANRLKQQRKTEDELEQRVAERSKELAAAQDELAEELKTMTKLHQLSTRLLATSELQQLLEEILDATTEMLEADFGIVQLYDAEQKVLRMVAQLGFKQDCLNHFDSVHEGTPPNGLAMSRRERVVIEDVMTDPGFAPHLEIAVSAGFRAVQSTPLFSRNGEILGMISTHFRQPRRPSQRQLRLIDLYAHLAAEFIEREQSAKALRASEERFRHYFELGLIGMAITSPDKGLLEVNDEFCRILGYEHDALLRMNWVELTHPDDINQDIAQFNRVMAGEFDGYTMDKRWIRKDGRVVDSIMSAKCARRSDGCVDYFVALVQDITHRKRAQEELHKANSELTHAARLAMLGELTASIAHELNQPLTAIVTNGHASRRFLSGAKPDLNSAREGVESMIKESVRASAIIKRIRTLLRKTTLETGPLNLDETIREVIALIDSELKSKEVQLHTQLASGIPLVAADRIQLQQVLLNLILNSKDAMTQPGWQTRTLLIKSERRTDSEVMVSVKDTGIGLDPSKAALVFEPFYTSKPDGLGLGLSISRSIIEAHGGVLSTMPNETGPGTTFQFTLPIRSAM